MQSTTHVLLRLLLPALLGLAVALPAAAQWKWRDANGQVTASDRAPPKEVAERDILERPNQAARRPAPAAAAAASAPAATSTPAAPAQTTAPAKTRLEAEVEARRRAAEQEAAAKARADAERQAQVRAENCRRARGHVVALESGQRMARTNERGEREVLDDKARADELRAAREVVASDCR
jgi:hypothetical protein